MVFFTDDSDGHLKACLEGTCTIITDAPSDAHVALPEQQRAAALEDLDHLTSASIESFAAMCRQCRRDFLLLLSLGHRFDSSMGWDDVSDLLDQALEPHSTSSECSGDEDPLPNNAAAAHTHRSSDMYQLLQVLHEFSNDEDDGGQFAAQLCSTFGHAALQLTCAASRLMAAACRWGCAGLGMTPCAAADVLLLASPLLRWKRQRFAAKHEPSVVDLLPLVELLRAHPSVDVSAADVDMQQLLGYDDAWDRWLMRHPELTAYLDPHHVLVLGPTPAQVTAALATVAIALQPEMGSAAIPFPQLFRCLDRASAYAAAAALRANFAHNAAAAAAAAPPLGGIQAGVVAHITYFSTQAGKISFI